MKRGSVGGIVYELVVEGMALVRGCCVQLF